MTARDGGRSYNVVFQCSLRAPGTLTPAVVNEFNRSFKVVRSLPCDVPLGDHPGQYNMHAKHAKLQGGGANPFIDPSNCTVEADIQEAMFRAAIEEQQKTTPPSSGAR
jgi:metallo-beta-lactamase class B